ncbi:hypothetical protein [Gluconobacter sphaericus]|nr:hypothetical protein [Gluconobacter sphaericus]
MKFDYVLTYYSGLWISEKGEKFSSEEVMDLERRFNIKKILS